MAAKSTPKKRPRNVGALFKSRWKRITRRRNNFLDRRPHRSFQLTRRRDIPTYTPLPGYIKHAIDTWRTIVRYKNSFIIFLAIYIISSAALVGIASQQQYQDLTEAFSTLGPELMGGNFDTFTETAALFGATVTGAIGSPLSEVQQLYVGFLSLLLWLTIVWFLRQRMAGVAVRVRDALYNAGAPLISTVIVVLVGAIQLLPAIIATLLYAAAETSGLISGVVAMMFAAVALLVVILSLYWATSTFFAALIVTVPGTYPFHALRLASDLIIGRRLSLLLRLLWLGLGVALLWVIVLVPAIVLAGWLNISWLPIVPLTLQILGGMSLLYTSTYLYLLYRRMIDEPA